MDEYTTPEKPVKKVAKKAPAKKAAVKKAAAKPPVEEKQLSDIKNNISEPSKYLVFMKRGASYSMSSGVVFDKNHPYQLVDFLEREALLSMPEDRFREATPDEAKKYYGNV